MAESTSHQQVKAKAAGRGGQQEVPLTHGRRLDALTASGNRATEVERSGTHQGLYAAARRLASSEASQKVLQVPQHDMPMAQKVMKNIGVVGTVKNMAGTKKISVR